MRFKTTQSELNKVINHVSRAVTTRSTMPILKGILLNVTAAGQLTLTASDLDLSIESTIDVYDAEEGSIVMPARLFADIIRKLPDEEVTITLEEYNNVSVKTSNSDFRIIGMNADEFPDIGNINETGKIVIKRESFREMIRKTSFAASTDESKGVLVGVLLELKDGNITMAALDGFRMAVASEPSENNADNEIIISARILNEINKIVTEEGEDTEDIELILDDKKAVITNASSRITLRMIEGKFLNYKGLLPKEFTTTVNVDRNMLTDSIERASLFAKEGRNNLIKLSIEDMCIRINSKSEAGNVNETVPAKKNGNNMEIGFNSKYLLDGLKAMKEDDIILKLNTNVTPCVIEPLDGGYTYLILPVRIMI